MLLNMILDTFATHYALGIEEIDADHWHLVASMNDIVSAIRTKDLMHVRELTTALRADMATHFASEERFMERVRYPYIKFHKQTHSELWTSITAITYKLESGLIQLNLERMLYTLLVGHIDNSDMQLSVYAGTTQIESVH